MYICEHYGIKELVPPEIYEIASNKKLLWLLFDKDLLEVIDALRDDYGPVIINDWPWDGSETMCGFRPFETNPEEAEYALFSQHELGRAFDLHFQNVMVEAVRLDILDQKKSYMKKIKGMELGMPWLHIDTRNNNANNIVTFRPK